MLLLFVLSSCNNFSDSDLVGRYSNFNYKYGPFVADIPYVKDTLVLKDDYTFQSSYFGVGKYELEKSLFKTEIFLYYEYEMGKACFGSQVEYDENGNPKIILFRDANHYYKRIE